jgi:hypothetical protein
MIRRFTAIIVIANIMMGLLLYLSSQAMLLHLASEYPVLTLTGVNLDKIYTGAVQPASSSSPLIITAYPNLPFYFLWLPLTVNAYFIIKVIRSSATAKRLPVFVSVGNIIMCLLTYSSIQTTLLSIAAVQQNYTGIGDVSFWSFSTNAVSVGGSVVPLFVALRPNLPSYAFLLSVILNACFIIKLLSEKSKKIPS